MLRFSLPAEYKAQVRYIGDEPEIVEYAYGDDPVDDLEVHQGSITEELALDELLRGVDCVISMLRQVSSNSRMVTGAGGKGLLSKVSGRSVGCLHRYRRS